MKTWGSRLLVGMALLAAALGPGSIPAARAINVPAADACYGYGATYVAPTTNVWTMDGSLSCVLHGYSYTGTTTSQSPNLCPGGGLSWVRFTGTLSRDNSAPVAASWVIVGASGVYAWTLNSGFGNFTGVVTHDDPSSCNSSFVGQMIVAVHVALSSPAPTALACRASGSVGPDGVGGSPSSGPMLQGPASGSGSCRSAESGTWDLQYTGSWAEGYSSNAWCPGDYDVHLTVTNRSTGRTLHQEQLWSPKEQNGEEMFYVESSYNGLPVGAGTITESPDACSYPMSMSTATNWVFVIPG